MVRVNIEVRYANSMDGCPEYYEASKDELLQETVLIAHEAAAAKYPKLKYEPYVIVPSKKWHTLPQKGFWFKEDPSQDYYDICFIVDKAFYYAEAEIIPVYLSLSPQADLPEIVVDFHEE